MLHHFNRAAVGITRDPYFNQNVLLLHGNGTSGGQNNTFLDSSNNNFIITRNGNATQGTFSPFSRPDGYWSNHFDGTGDYLTIADNTALEVPTQDFTFECFVYFNAVIAAATAGATFIQKGTTAASNLEYVFRLIYDTINVNKFEFVWSSNGTTASSIVSTTTAVANQWYHVAVTRSGTTATLFVNGVQEAQTTSYPATTFSGTGAVGIGSTNAGINSLDGYLSNLRIIKGTAVYTDNFTPPTTPLTAITNTQLLTCQSNRFIDNSSNAFTFTRNGNTSTQTFGPLNLFAPYSTGVVGGSGYFDGTGDYLTVPASSAFTFGTGAYTVEAWAYFNSGAGNQNIVDMRGIAGAGNQVRIAKNSNNLNLGFGASDSQISTTWVGTGSWVHLAASRESSNVSFFVNGTRVGTLTDTTNLSQGIPLIGTYASATGNFNGYISNVRIVTGTAVYNPTATSITVPTAPLNSVANTSLLCNFTNGNIIDNAGILTFETVSTARCNTVIKKYGTGSISFNGTTDYLISPSSNNIAFGTGDFTAEFWVYFNNTTSRRDLIWLGRSSSDRGGIIYNFVAANLTYYIAPTVTSAINAPFSPTANVWYHIAITRASGSSRLFIDGVQGGSTYTDTKNYIGPCNVYIGRDSAAASSYLNGYIDDLRITKGIARYTSNFTPPQQPFADF